MGRGRRRVSSAGVATVIVWQNGIAQVFDQGGNPLPRRGGRIDRMGHVLNRDLHAIHWRWRIWPGGQTYHPLWLDGRTTELMHWWNGKAEARKMAEEERDAGRLLYQPMDV